MASPSDEELDAFIAVFQSDAGLPSWSEAGDLGRISVEAFSRSATGREATSSGSLRLAGTGVHDNAVDLTVVGVVCQGFQRLITATAASSLGIRSARGKLSEGVLSQSRLVLAASPAPGSVILTITPPPLVDDAPVQGDLGLVEPPVDLLDAAIAKVIDLFETVTTADVAEDACTPLLQDLGPRACGALELVAKTVGADEIDMELSWSKPRAGTQRASLTAADARWLGNFVSSHRLDEAEVQFDGVLHTISDRRPFEVSLDEGDIVSIKLGDQVPEQVGSLRIGERVRIKALEKVKLDVGGGESKSYTLVDIAPLAE